MLQGKGAHVLLYEKHVGLVPFGLVLDHICRNKLCVNPNHLEPVTNAINNQRGANAKLTVSNVVEIRHRHSNGESKAVLAAEYNVTPKNIYAITSRKSWKNV
jgi:HNH endonuclease